MEGKSYVKANAEYEVRNITLYQLFDEARQDVSKPDSQLLCMDSGNKVSMEDIWSKADKYAKGMLGMGMKRGDTLTVIACVSEEMASLFLAAVSIGVGYSHPYVYEPRNTSIQDIIPLIEPKMLIVGEGMQGETLDTLTELLEEKPNRFPFIENFYYDATGGNRNPEQPWLKPLSELIKAGETITVEELTAARNLVQPEDPAMHLFTSGSTGQPKAVVHSNYNIVNELFTQCPRNIKSVMVNSVNLDELISYSGIWVALCKYTELTIMAPAFEMSQAQQQMKDIVEILNTEKVEHLALSSGYVLHLLELVKEGEHNFPNLKTVMLAGQAFSAQLRNDILQNTGAIPWNAYGMSEALNIGFCPKGFDEESIRQRMNGYLVAKNNVEIKLVDKEGEVVDKGVEGELLCRSFSLMTGYKNSGNEEAAQQLFTEDGYIRSGDMAVMHNDGSFEIKGRKTDVLRFKIFMETVYPAPIEDAMSKHPAINEIAVISVAVNDVIGDEIIFCIRLHPGSERPSEEELINHLLQHQNEMKRPCRIIYFDKLPRTNNGRKMSRKKLQQKVKNMLAEDPSLGCTKWFSQMSQD